MSRRVSKYMECCAGEWPIELVAQLNQVHLSWAWLSLVLGRKLRKQNPCSQPLLVMLVSAAALSMRYA